MTDPDENPFWGEPTPTDLWDDLKRLDSLYEELEWDHRDLLEFTIEGNHITIGINQEKVDDASGCLSLLFGSKKPFH